jgi:hypothetical protein
MNAPPPKLLLTTMLYHRFHHKNGIGEENFFKLALVITALWDIGTLNNSLIAEVEQWAPAEYLGRIEAYLQRFNDHVDAVERGYIRRLLYLVVDDMYRSGYRFTLPMDRNVGSHLPT